MPDNSKQCMEETQDDVKVWYDDESEIVFSRVQRNFQFCTNGWRRYSPPATWWIFFGGVKDFPFRWVIRRKRIHRKWFTAPAIGIIYNSFYCFTNCFQNKFFSNLDGFTTWQILLILPPHLSLILLLKQILFCSSYVFKLIYENWNSIKDWHHCIQTRTARR